jgi:hypothetical protein
MPGALRPLPFVQLTDLGRIDQARITFPVAVRAQEHALSNLGFDPVPGNVHQMPTIERKRLQVSLDVVKIEHPTAGLSPGVSAAPASPTMP